MCLVTKYFNPIKNPANKEIVTKIIFPDARPKEIKYSKP